MESDTHSGSTGIRVEEKSNGVHVSGATKALNTGAARYEVTKAFNGPTTNQAHVGIGPTLPAGEIYDCTMVIGIPQLEKGERASSPIASGGVRSADSVVVELSGFDWSNGLYGVIGFVLFATHDTTSRVFEVNDGIGNGDYLTLRESSAGDKLGLGMDHGGVEGWASLNGVHLGARKIAFGFAQDFTYGNAGGVSSALESAVDYVTSEVQELHFAKTYWNGPTRRSSALIKSFVLFAGTPTTAIVDQLGSVS